MRNTVVHVVSGFHLHLMFYRGNLNCFSNRGPIRHFYYTKILKCEALLICNIFTLTAGCWSLRVHHLHGHPSPFHPLRLAGGARDQESNHRGGDGPVQKMISQTMHHHTSYQEKCWVLKLNPMSLHKMRPSYETQSHVSPSPTKWVHILKLSPSSRVPVLDQY